MKKTEPETIRILTAQPNPQHDFIVFPLKSNTMEERPLYLW